MPDYHETKRQFCHLFDEAARMLEEAEGHAPDKASSVFLTSTCNLLAAFIGTWIRLQRLKLMVLSSNKWELKSHSRTTYSAKTYRFLSRFDNE